MQRKLLISLVSFAACFSAQSASAATVSTPNSLGLVGWWPFNEGTSTIAHDIGPYQNNAALTGFSVPATASSGWASGKRGAALAFDGTDDRIIFTSCEIGARINGAEGVSSSRWVYVDTVPGAASGYIADFVTTGGGGSGHTMLINDSMNVTVQARSTSADSLQSFNSNAAIPLRTWVHAAATVDYSTDTINIYINGVLDKTTSATFANTTFTQDPCTSDDVIGSSPTPDRYMDGKIDDYRIFSRVLTAAEIANIYGSGQMKRQTVSNSGLVGWWTFDEGTSTRATDFSGSLSTSTMFSSPIWVAGKRGGALDFDGTDDYLTTSLNRSSYSSITVAAWVKYEGSISDPYRAIFGGQSANFFVGKNTGNSNIGIQDGNFNGNVAVGTNAWDGNWHHIAYTNTGGVGTVYLDGSFVGSAALSGGSGQIWIAQELESNGYDFNGKIDDVRIYSRVLSADEIKDLYRQNQTEVGGSQETRGPSLGLVGYWSLNGKDVDWRTHAAFDRSGLGNNGVITNMSTTSSPAAGRVGQALSFNGSTSYVSVPYSAALAPITAISYGGWFKTRDRTVSQKMISKTETGGYAFVLNEAVGGCSGTSLCGFVGVSVAGTNTYFGASYDRSNITNNKWHHVMTTYDGETVLLYLDGVQVASNTTPSGPINYSTSNTLCIGTEPGATCGVTQFFSGDIDEVRVYNRTLSAEEVKQLYGLGK